MGSQQQVCVCSFPLGGNLNMRQGQGLRLRRTHSLICINWTKARLKLFKQKCEENKKNYKQTASCFLLIHSNATRTHTRRHFRYFSIYSLEMQNCLSLQIQPSILLFIKKTKKYLTGQKDMKTFPFFNESSSPSSSHIQSITSWSIPISKTHLGLLHIVAVFNSTAGGTRLKFRHVIY